MSVQSFPLCNPFCLYQYSLHSTLSRSSHVFTVFVHHLQFLAQLKLMDYSLLVGIHDVERAEQEDVESEDNEAEEEGESDGGGIGTPPDSPSNTLDSTKPLSPGEFDPAIDVYAIKSNESELSNACNGCIEQLSDKYSTESSPYWLL